MFTIRCHFQFADGATAVAEVSLPSPHSEGAVRFSGEANRLLDRDESSTAGAFEAWARGAARSASAELGIETEGEYDWAAE